MKIDNVDFDIDSRSKGLLSILCQDDDGLSYYFCCAVFNSNGLKFNYKSCELLGCGNEDGEIETDKPAVDLLKSCLSIPGAMIDLKTSYWLAIR